MATEWPTWKRAVEIVALPIEMIEWNPSMNALPKSSDRPAASLGM